MLSPMLGFVAGSLIVLYAYLCYAEGPLPQTPPSFLRHKGDLPWFVAWAMIGLALIGEMAGFLLKRDLGLERILLGGGGLALLFAQTWWRKQDWRFGKAGLSALLFAVLLTLFYGSPVRTSFDSRWAVHTAMSFARGHWGDLSEYMPILEKEQLYAIEYAKSRPHTLFPIGVSLLSVPAMAVVSMVHPTFNEGLRYAIPVGFEGLLAAIYGSLIGVLFYWVVFGRFNSHYVALAATLVLCFCTSVWSTATRGLWQHAPVILMFVVAMILLLEASRRSSIIQYLGLPLAMSFISRPSAAVGVAIFSLYVLIFYRRWFVRYVAWSLLLAVPWITYNVLTYDALFPPYYVTTYQPQWSISDALLGNLVSPARGLFIYSPILLLALPGFLVSLRERSDRALHVTFAAIIVAHWLVVSRLGNPWWGGHSYGPRFMTDILPFLVYFVAFCLGPSGRPSGWTKGNAWH